MLCGLFEENWLQTNDNATSYQAPCVEKVGFLHLAAQSMSGWLTLADIGQTLLHRPMSR